MVKRFIKYSYIKYKYIWLLKHLLGLEFLLNILGRLTTIYALSFNSYELKIGIHSKNELYFAICCSLIKSIKSSMIIYIIII